MDYFVAVLAAVLAAVMFFVFTYVAGPRMLKNPDGTVRRSFGLRIIILAVTGAALVCGTMFLVRYVIIGHPIGS